MNTWLPLADALARDAWVETRGALSLIELRSHAREGLWRAARRTTLAGKPFEPVARAGVRAALLALLRAEGAVHERAPHARAKQPVDASDRRDLAEWSACRGPTFVGMRRRTEDAVDRDDVSPEDLVADAEIFAHVHRALASLEAEDRRLIDMCFFDELTFEEIGDRLGVARTWAFRRVAVALARLSRAVRRADVLA